MFNKCKKLICKVNLKKKIRLIIFFLLYQNYKGLSKDCGVRRNDSGVSAVYIPKPILVWYTTKGVSPN
jgi:hypothetical protein